VLWAIACVRRSMTLIPLLASNTVIEPAWTKPKSGWNTKLCLVVAYNGGCTEIT
jgi:hypothetical protein